MIWNWFKDSWMVTRQAAKLFIISAVIILASIPFFLGKVVDIAKMSFWVRLPWAIFFLMWPVAVMFLWAGMWRHWVRIDNSSRWAKRMWFIVLLVGFWWGSCLYCFFVYLPQTYKSASVET